MLTARGGDRRGRCHLRNRAGWRRRRRGCGTSRSARSGNRRLGCGRARGGERWRRQGPEAVGFGQRSDSQDRLAVERRDLPRKRRESDHHREGANGNRHERNLPGPRQAAPERRRRDHAFHNPTGGWRRPLRLLRRRPVHAVDPRQQGGLVVDGVGQPGRRHVRRGRRRQVLDNPDAEGQKVRVVRELARSRRRRARALVRRHQRRRRPRVLWRARNGCRDRPRRLGRGQREAEDGGAAGPVRTPSDSNSSNPAWPSV